MKRALVILFFVLGCHAPSAGHDAGGPSAACSALGATCTFAPGKLGTCVEVEHPGATSSLVCQSQH